MAVKNPEDPRALGALELQFERLFAADPTLGAEVSRLWAQAQAEGIVRGGGERSVTVGGSVQGSTIITGDSNTIQRPPDR